MHHLRPLPPQQPPDRRDAMRRGSTVAMAPSNSGRSRTLEVAFAEGLRIEVGAYNPLEMKKTNIDGAANVMRQDVWKFFGKIKPSSLRIGSPETRRTEPGPVSKRRRA
jgi:hypothetical protein